ncbi:unnamed protein product [Dibothriocephalus latus]|uniref:Asteroid domain-containing protein n=1 Tax=Dibothriocephalus latus TaxID=60516 RepID=A0A3P7N969_DIBLA|nr:unnamed protein product [Dibothriocephalus latus]
MGVLSLTRLIGSDCKSFKVKKLHSSMVIINGIEFMHSVLKSLDVGSEGIFGVDHLCVKFAIEEAVRRLKKCGLDPIFVIQGLPPRHGKDYNWKVIRSYTKRRPVEGVPASSHSKQEDCIVLYSRSLICSVLSSLGMRFYMCLYGANSVCAALSIILGCPVLSSNSDFYLFYKPVACSQKEYNAVEYAPLSSFSLDPTPDTPDLSITDAPTYFLAAHVYTPEFSPLNSIPESSRPIVALAMDSILIRELPSAVGIPSYAPGQPNMDPFTKLQHVVDWLQRVDQIQAIQSILECVGNPHKAHNVANNIIDFLPKFLPDFTGASRLLSYLGVTNGCNLDIKTPHLERNENFSPFAFFKDVLEILKGNIVAFDRPEFTSGWPSALQSLYHSGNFCPGLLTALYCKDGRVMHPFLPCLYEFPEEGRKGRILRHLSYALFIGLENRLGFQRKLLGVRPHVKEVIYNGNGQFITCHLHVKPLDLPPDSSLDSFFAKYLSFNPIADIPDWCNVLLLCCSIWHSQTEPYDRHSHCSISQCPPVLSFLLCAVVHYFNSALDTSTLLKHYSSLLSFSRTEGEKYVQPANSELTTVSVETSTVLDIYELVNIYGELIDLVYLLNALLHPTDAKTPTDSNYSSSLPLGMLIPSFHLAHQIALCLILNNESAKSTLAARFWLPKLFYPSPDPAAAMKLRDAAILFTKLVNALPTIRVKWEPLDFDITDPPTAFVPKSQRTPGSINQKQFVNPRQRTKPASSERTNSHANVCPPRSATLRDSSNIPPGMRNSPMVRQRISAPTEYNTRKTSLAGSGRGRGRGAANNGGRSYADRLIQRYSQAPPSQ